MSCFYSSASDRSRVYVCGRSNTGALGNVVSKLPTSRTHRYVQYPKRTSFGEKYDVRDVACGYGFTVFTDGKFTSSLDSRSLEKSMVPSKHKASYMMIQ